MLNANNKIILKIIGKGVKSIDRGLTWGSSTIPAVDRKKWGEEDNQSLLFFILYPKTRDFANTLCYTEFFLVELPYGQ